MSRERHRVMLAFEDGCGLSAKLICPESGCTPAGSCAACGRDLDDSESKPCYDCTDSAEWRDECWVKTWFDNVSADELLSGRVTVEIDADWDGDHMIAHIVGVVPEESIHGKAANE
jgi:hypothetical protein